MPMADDCVRVEFRRIAALVIRTLERWKNMMAVDEQLERLSRQLSKQTLGPIDTVFNEAMFRIGSAATSLAAWLRQAVYDQPLTTLLLSCQIGYLTARLGRRYARR
jgi:hypothetical protein